jgi:hypothetical protein
MLFRVFDKKLGKYWDELEGMQLHSIVLNAKGEPGLIQDTEDLIGNTKKVLFFSKEETRVEFTIKN